MSLRRPRPRVVPARLAALLVVGVWALSPQRTVTAQDAAAPQTESPAEAAAAQKLALVRQSVMRGRPDYALARQALREAEATDNLRLKADANLVQARLDSAGRRYSKALPLFHRATDLTREADRIEAAAALAAANAEAAAAEEARVAAEESRAATEATLESERSAAQLKYVTVIGICLAILAVGILAFLATVRSLRGKIRSARTAQEEADVAYAEARAQVTASSRSALKRLRRIMRTLAARLPTGPAATPVNQLAAQNAALHYLAQSSFEQGDRHEVAMEAFYDKFNGELSQLLNPNPGVQLLTDSMPLRLPLDQAVPVALIYTELVGNAFKHGGGKGRVTAQMTKEGDSVTLTVRDEGYGSIGSHPHGEGMRLVHYLAEEIGGKVDYPDGDGGAVRLRFKATGVRGTATAPDADRVRRAPAMA